MNDENMAKITVERGLPVKTEIKNALAITTITSLILFYCIL